MKSDKRLGWLLVGVAIWNFFIWITFAKNLSAAHSRGEEHPQGYWIAHTVLIVVDLIIGAVLGVVGAKRLRAGR
ncbi:SCO4848 family membrane protein [Nocardioides sp.]|uniref:SCO4848 family membrane protein n=1 Tax=Nocardioides sp. TaxID=35761 RepID=UPI0039E692CC